ncbi:hypothetical protein HY636_03425 [Candidatus Woesearchaeota archaeon]|nr:hypothetical protein [Candidatus Woesearchaeota archaeon]
MKESPKKEDIKQETNYDETKKSIKYTEKDESIAKAKQTPTFNLSSEFYMQAFLMIIIIIVIIALTNVFQLASLGGLFEQKLAEAKEAAKPIPLQLTTISTSACEDCYDITPFVDTIKSYNVNITSEKKLDFYSEDEKTKEEVKQLIEKYNIEKLPAAIITADFTNPNLNALISKIKEMGELKEDGFLFTKITPPFVDAKTSAVRGKVSLTLIKDSSCKECVDLSPLKLQLTELGLKIKNDDELDISSTKAQNLIKKYDIEKIPTIILDKEAEVYQDFTQLWAIVGTVAKDGSYIMKTINPPYFSIKEGKVKGFVSLIALTDSACTECYDAALFHKPILESVGVVFSEEKDVDISSAEGKELVKKYSIKKVPTIILKGDIDEYKALAKAWLTVGTVESDGAYIFRKVEVAQKTYQNLETGKTETVPIETASS